MAQSLVRLSCRHRTVFCSLLNGNQVTCYFSSKIPKEPQWKEIKQDELPSVPELSDEMINHLERLSLVDFNNKAGVERLQSAIHYANELHVVDTHTVEPMYSVLEDEQLLLTDDCVSEGNCRQEILQNATITEEDYFVAPPGNIPLKQKQKQFEKESTNSL